MEQIVKRPRTECKNCAHFDVCKNRKAFEELLEKDVINNILHAVNDIHESFNIELTCEHYKFDWPMNMRNSEVIKIEPVVKKSRFGLFK